MNEELLETLKASLLKNGVPEDVVNFSFSEVLGETEEVKPETEQAPEDKVEETELEEEVPTLEATEDEVKGEEEEQPMTDEVEVAENVEQPVLPPELLEKIEKIDLLARDNEELKKANEGLQAKVDALLDSLRQAGVIESSAVNTINPPTPEITGNCPQTDVMVSILDVINGKRHY